MNKTNVRNGGGQPLLNNKGFALSAILYIILILAVVLITLTLSILSSRKIILDRQREVASSVIYEENGLSYRQVLSILRLEAIKYAEDNRLTSGIFLVRHSNIGEKILKKYKLYDEELFVTKNETSYDVYMKDLKSRLPKEYQEVEYIESSGTQYIDTGIIPTINTGINIDYAYPTISANTNAGICGIYQPNIPRTDALLITTSDGKTNTNGYLISRGAVMNVGTTFTRNKKYNAKINWLNDDKLDFNSGQTIENNGSNSIASAKIILFGRYYNGSYSFSTARIYNCQFSEDDEIIRDFVPCYRKSDNAIGMYDTVNNIFYINQGTGGFLKGPDGNFRFKKITNYTVDSSISNKYLNLLPIEYQEVEYIESSGTQYIDLGIVPTANSVAEVKYKVVQFVSARQGRIFGSDDNGNFHSNAFAFSLIYSSTKQFGVGFGNQVYSGGNTDNTNIHVARLSKDGFYLDNTLVCQYSNTSLSSNRNIYLFNVNFGSALNDNVNSRIYYFKLWNGNSLIRNMIPCYRKSDGVVGLYDLVNNTFYVNQGTGSFIAGPEV